jgi:hypothetical protein
VPGAIAVAALLICLRAIVPLKQGVLLSAIVVAFALPGVAAARLVFAPGPGRLLAACTIGPIWGYGLSSVALLALWAAGLRGGVLLIAPLLAVLLGLGLARLAPGRVAARPARRSDLAALLVLVLFVPLLVGRPFSRLGEMVPDGRAYRAYFTADTVWRMAVVAELSKGDFPPRNPFHRADRMHYYWLAHLLSAAEYQAMHKRVSVEQILLVHSLALDVAFVLFFFGFVRQWVESTAAALVACLVALLGSSFEGLERLIYLWRRDAALGLVDTLNIDAVTRWFYDSLPVDGLHRLLWYQPHHSTGYAMGLSAVLVASEADDGLAPGVMVLCGTLLGLCLLLSSFSAIMLTLMVGGVVLWRAWRERAWLRAPLAAVCGAIPLAAATYLTLSLRYVDKSTSSLLYLTFNPLAFHHPAAAIVLSFGPLLAGATVGAVLAARSRTWRIVPIAVVVVVSFFFYFFVDLRDHQFVYVGWRAGHFLFIAFATLTGYALQELARRPPRAAALWVAVACFLVVLSLPTFAIDFFNTQDLSNRRMAAGFRWTLVLSHDEIAMFNWIKRYTPPDAIVQVEPYCRDPNTWAYVPAFAERRMAAGLPISMVPLGKYETASIKIRELYQERDPENAYMAAAKLGIDYLVVGGPEREAYPHFEGMLRSSPAHFQEVFQSKDVSLFLVEGGYHRLKALPR